MKDLRYLLVVPGAMTIALGFVSEQKIAKATVWTDAPKSMSIATMQRLPSVATAIKRNPFDGAPTLADATKTSSSNPPVPKNLTTNPIAGTPTLGTAVPNPGGGPGGPLDLATTGDPGAVVAQPGDPNGAIYVISTVVGAGQPPLAMLRNGTETDIVGVGDSIGKRRITHIVSEGIQFDDGSRLALASTPTTGSSGGTNPSTLGNQIPQNASGGAPGEQTSTPPPAATNGAAPGTAPTSTQSGIPVIHPSPYNFGPLATPQPGTTPAPVPHFYPAPAGNGNS